MTSDREHKRLRKEKLGDAFSQLERPISDMKYMSVIAETMLEEVLDLSLAEKVDDVYRFDLTKDQIDATTFAVMQMGDMIRTLNANYFVVLNADEGEV